MGRALELFTVWLFLAIVAFNVSFTLIEIEQDLYIRIFYYSAEILNCPLVLSLFTLWGCFKYKFYLSGLFASLGLVAMNVNNFVFMYFRRVDYQEYVQNISFTMSIVIALMVLIFYTNKKLKYFKL